MSDTIEARVGGWLDGRKPPNGLDDTQKASLRSDIIQAVRGAAPATDVENWLGQLLERIILLQKTGGWPYPQVWATTARAMGGQKPAEPTADTTETERRISDLCARITRGEGVDERDLFNEKVCGRALRDQRVSLADVRTYQRAAFLKRKKVYGKAKALDWIAPLAPKLAAMLRDEFVGEPEIRTPHAADRQGDEGKLN